MTYCRRGALCQSLKRPGSAVRKTIPAVACNEVNSGCEARSNSSRCDCPSSPVYKRKIPMYVPSNTRAERGPGLPYSAIIYAACPPCGCNGTRDQGQIQGLGRQGACGCLTRCHSTSTVTEHGHSREASRAKGTGATVSAQGVFILGATVSAQGRQALGATASAQGRQALPSVSRSKLYAQSWGRGRHFRAVPPGCGRLFIDGTTAAYVRSVYGLSRRYTMP